MWTIKELADSTTSMDTKMKELTNEGKKASQIATLCPSIGVKEELF